MKTTVALIALLLALAASVPVEANWQYTKWGMTPEQVKAAAGSRSVQRVSDDEAAGHRIKDSRDQAVLKSTWKSGDFEFQVFFYFRDGKKLSQVSLELEDAANQGLALVESLTQKYGKPFPHSEEQFLELYVWHGETDQVSYLGIGTKVTNLPGAKATVNVRYQPLNNADNDAL